MHTNRALMQDKTGLLIAEKLGSMVELIGQKNDRIQSLDDTELTTTTVEAVGAPVYVSDVAEYSAYGIEETGWYVFARINAKEGIVATEGTTIEGAAGSIVTEGAGYVDVAVHFSVAAESQVVVVDWGGCVDKVVFKATDLAIRNLDYRVTFYVYDIEPFATWSYELTTDTTFAEGKHYYTKSGEEYTLAEVTTGEEVPADTYYVHSGVTFEGMTRNVTYVCNVPIDCPVTFNLPEIESDTHGAWFEIRFQHEDSYSSTLVVPEGVKVATEHTRPETAGFNTVDLHYSSIGGVKVWRFLNTHSTLPATS